MGEIYLEILPVDKALRVTAVDSQTGVEVVFTAPQHASRDRIDRLARAKLRRRLLLDQGVDLTSDRPGEAAPPPTRGKLV